MRRPLVALISLAVFGCQADVPSAPLSRPLLDASVTEPSDAFTLFTDEATFLAVSGATVAVTYPTARGLTPAPYVEGGVTLVQAAGFNNAVDDFTPVFDGREFAVSGAENVDVTFDADTYGFGLWMQDGFDVGFINWSPALDSRFAFTFHGVSGTLGSVVVDPPVDQPFFLGAVSATVPITRVEIREVDSDIDNLYDPYVENDFFSRMFTSTAPPAPDSMDDCKDGGWRVYGFVNQGLCIRSVHTGRAALER